MTQTIIKFLTAGNVDDGKSTLIGRLLYDTDALHQDHIDEVTRSTDASFAGGDMDFSLFLDGLSSERSQRITIDAAYRYFSYAEQKFIIADAPGHEQYTRNMAVAASNSDIAIVLIDASKGIKTQTIRHSYIAHLFGIKHIIVAVNKMDLVDYDQKVFDAIRASYQEKTASLGFTTVDFVPIVALSGENIVRKGSALRWYQGKSIVDYLLAIKAQTSTSSIVRLHIQNVIKDNQKRYYQALLSKGTLSIGDSLLAYPTQKEATITDIIHSTKPVDRVGAGSAILLRLDKDLDLDRGGLLSDTLHKPHYSERIEAYLLWFSETDSSQGSEYLIKLNHHYARATIQRIHYGINADNLEQEKGASPLGQNAIAKVTVLVSERLAFDDFSVSRKTGNFLLIDKESNETLACGIIATESIPPTQKVGWWQKLRQKYAKRSNA